MRIPELTIATIIMVLSACGQQNSKIERNKQYVDTIAIEKIENNQFLSDTTVQILWCADQYDEKLKDTFNTIILNEHFCRRVPDAARAALGYVATFIGNDCWWDGEPKDDRSNLKCKILSALDLGYQCSDKHLGFLRQWFRDDKKALQKLQSCPTTPYTSTIQDSFDEIKLTIEGDKILVWFSAYGVNVREGESWSWTETDHFQVGHDKIRLVKVDKLEVEHEKFNVRE